MFKKILIANRGEIACRVAATARRLGLHTVAVYSDADAQRQARGTPATRRCTLAAQRPKTATCSWERIIASGSRPRALQAIHPGYGFLSENEEFAQACADAGLVFIGPPASAIAAMGLKAESKRLMEQAGVPLVPGYHGADQDPALAAGARPTASATPRSSRPAQAVAARACALWKSPKTLPPPWPAASAKRSTALAAMRC